ncbi:GlsB/YeaQ/YmgE family stress response membrane protein [Fulvimonas sp. R45]|uniref:GlsB/YeaQ/YmgE family stress response membrane protein n=1 Tax=Fulvimonas sp. R45 TaxID=3045937 RepID=UPI00265DEE81|nr:GlsB/YeaQ/YmgE family stress response membrane protein [Fulvimonas sp. R45]MDO1530274.1 GlsB/YeaQ/YmgE family stress response membrane protein [Fulvimonas sp. R45]
MHWLWVFIVGLVVGIIAKLITPGKDPGGFIITAIIGIIGSVLATWVGEHLGWWGPTGLVHFIASIVGAIILLVIYHAVFKRNASS